MPHRPYSSSAGAGRASSGGSCRIWWDDSIGLYRISIPYRKEFIDAFKLMVPGSDRAYDEQTKIWTFTERFLPAIRKLAEGVFGTAGVAVIEKSQVRAVSSPPAVANFSIDELLLRFMKLLPYDAARAAYRSAAMTLHPDRGGDVEKCTSLNTMWDRIQREYFKQG